MQETVLSHLNQHVKATMLCKIAEALVRNRLSYSSSHFIKKDKYKKIIIP